MSIFNIDIVCKKNKYIIDEFIKYYEFINANQDILQKSPQEIYYKLLNIKRILNILSKYKKEITIEELPNIKKIKYVGDKTIQRIYEILTTKKLSEIQNISKKIDTINELTKIYGIGTKKAINFYNQNILTIEDLKKHENLLTSAQKISLYHFNNLCDKIPRIIILSFEVWLLQKIHEFDIKYIITICGSYRRESNYSSDIDILITHDDIKNNKNTEKYLNEIVEILYQNKFLLNTLSQGQNHFLGYACCNNIKNISKKFNKIIRVDIKIVAPESLWCATMHMTGNYQFNEKIRGIAKSKNMKLNEYYLTKNNKKLKIMSEQDIFKYLDIEYVSPNNRNY